MCVNRAPFCYRTSNDSDTDDDDNEKLKERKKHRVSSGAGACAEYARVSLNVSSVDCLGALSNNHCHISNNTPALYCMTVQIPM